jgi:hypothetical protein
LHDSENKGGRSPLTASAESEVPGLIGMRDNEHCQPGTAERVLLARMLPVCREVKDPTARITTRFRDISRTRVHMVARGVHVCEEQQTSSRANIKRSAASTRLNVASFRTKTAA